MNTNSNHSAQGKSNAGLFGYMKALDNKIEAWIYNLIIQLDDQNQSTLN